MRLSAPYILVVMGERSRCKGGQHRKIHRHEWEDPHCEYFFSKFMRLLART